MSMRSEKLTEGTLKKLYRKINWDHKKKTDLLEPIWIPNIVRIIQSGDKVVNNDNDKVKKKEKRLAEKKRRNSQGACKSVKGRRYFNRLKIKADLFDKWVDKKIEENENIQQES